MKLHHVALTASTFILAMAAFYFRTEVDRNVPTPDQALGFLEVMFEQKVRLNSGAASVELIGPDGSAVHGHPSLLSNAEALECSSATADYIDTRAGRYYDSDYLCLYRVWGPEDVAFHVAAYISRSEDPTLRYRVDGYGFRLLGSNGITELMTGLNTQIDVFDAEAQTALWEQLERLGFDVPDAPGASGQRSPFSAALDNL